MNYIIKTVLPRLVKDVIKKARILALRGSRFYCPVCERGLRKFYKFGVNTRPNTQCSGCDSLDRHRFLWIALRDLQNKGLSFGGGRNCTM